MDLDKVVAHYLPKKIANELSLGDIRKELAEKGYTKDEISDICSTLSDRELAAINSTSQQSGGFLNHPTFSYLMILISLVIFVISLQKLLVVIELRQEVEVPLQYYLWPIFFIIGSLFFSVKHFLKLKSRKKG
ncbi:MAG: hypothetical protein WDZ35_06265 [Crocinitomicaceae bacterium]